MHRYSAVTAAQNGRSERTDVKNSVDSQYCEGIKSLENSGAMAAAAKVQEANDI